MPTEMLAKDEQRVSPPLPLPAAPAEEAEEDALREAAQRRRVRRTKIQLAVWGLASILTAALWVLHEWQANGAFERFAHGGNPGDWNPTLPALVIGLWGLVAGIVALHTHFARPATAAEVECEVERLGTAATAAGVPADGELRRLVRERLERRGRLRFHLAAWALGMIVVAPLNALVEWQDNGGFERFGRNSRPGSWDPWVLYVGGIWALAIVALALWLRFDPARRRARAAGDLRRLEPR